MDYSTNLLSRNFLTLPLAHGEASLQLPCTRRHLSGGCSTTSPTLSSCPAPGPHTRTTVTRKCNRKSRTSGRDRLSPGHWERCLSSRQTQHPRQANTWQLTSRQRLYQQNTTRRHLKHFPPPTFSVIWSSGSDFLSVIFSRVVITEPSYSVTAHGHLTDANFPSTVLIMKISIITYL